MPAGSIYKYRRRKQMFPRRRQVHGKTYGRSLPRTNKLSAYKRSNKKRFIAKSNPIQENKQVEGSQLSSQLGTNPDGTPVLYNMAAPPPTLPDASGYAMNTSNFVFIPDSPCYQIQGMDDHQCIGRSTFQRICAAKFLIKWPQSTLNTGINMESDPTKPDRFVFGVLPDIPQSYKLYWGFVPMKHMLTGQTDPIAPNASAHYLETQVKQRISDYFDERLDRLRFIPKKTSTINIIGSKQLRAPNYNLGRQAVSGDAADTADGNIADTLVKITWPMNRKIHFEKSSTFAWDPSIDVGTGEVVGPVAPSTGANVLYRNYDHIPFACIVSWNHNKLPEDDTSIVDPDDEEEFYERYARQVRCPHVLINDITYYRDS